MLPTKRLPITIDGTPQPLHLHLMNGTEELGKLFEYSLEIYSENQDLAFDALLGAPMTVCLALVEGTRFFNGIITRLRRVGTSGRYLVFRATLSPRLWLLSRTSDCRIYQKKSVPEVVKEVLREHAIPFSDRLDLGSYNKWDYLTQYRESDLAFISRIMEREGIYYYFKHTQTSHEMVLSDSVTSHDTREHYDQIPLWPLGSAQADRDHLTSWQAVNEIASAGVTLQAHDYRLRRGANIKAVARTAPEYEQDEFQVYEYTGHYVGAQNEETADAGDVRTAGEHYSRTQLDEHRSAVERLEVEGNVLGLEAGALFQIDDLAAPTDQLLAVSTHLELRNADFESSGNGGDDTEICHLTCSALNRNRQFRPSRTALNPVVAGPETAIVVGPKGQEIHTDKFGRVRIQFHWDREGPSNEGSTCWVRVAQMWAGSNWGSMFIPRIGHEVVVQFLGGDPDRPIIVGSVYNADNSPPYSPQNATQSGIKTRSSKGGTANNFNEIRFEDKKGDEELFIQAEKNKTVKVKKDRSASVGANDSVSVGGDRSLTVTGNLSVTVKGGGKSPNHSSHSVTGKHNLHASDTVEVDAPTHIKLACGGSSILIEPGKITLQAGGKALVVLDAHVLAQSSDKSKMVLDANVLAKSSAGSTVVLDANAAVAGTKVTATGKMEAVLTAGAGTVKTTPAGVDVTGPLVKVNS